MLTYPPCVYYVEINKCYTYRVRWWKDIMLRKLRDTRLAQGKTQSYMAKQPGYRYASGYANIEMGRTKPSLEKAQQISELLDGDVNELFLMKSYTKRVKPQRRRCRNVSQHNDRAGSC